MSENQIENKKKNKSVFEPYHTPHDTVPFDRIKMEDYEEAFMEGYAVTTSKSARPSTTPKSLPSTTPSSTRTKTRTIIMTCCRVCLQYSSI